MVYFSYQATVETRKKVDPALTAALRSCFWMAKEDNPLNKYSSVMQPQKFNGYVQLENMGVGKNVTYCYVYLVTEFDGITYSVTKI